MIVMAFAKVVGLSGSASNPSRIAFCLSCLRCSSSYWDEREKMSLWIRPVSRKRTEGAYRSEGLFHVSSVGRLFLGRGIAQGIGFWSRRDWPWSIG